jgi:hypothetical protein
MKAALYSDVGQCRAGGKIAQCLDFGREFRDRAQFFCAALSFFSVQRSLAAMLFQSAGQVYHQMESVGVRSSGSSDRIISADCHFIEPAQSAIIATEFSRHTT